MDITEHPWGDGRSWSKFATDGTRERRVDLRYLPDGGAVLSHTDSPVGWEGNPTWGEGEWTYADATRAEQHAADLLQEARIVADFEKHIRERRRTRSRYRVVAPWYGDGDGMDHHE
jgi:hypothetical protein